MKERLITTNPSIITIGLNKQYDLKKEQNEKLSFLSNPITRPFALVENPENKPNCNEPEYSLATASRLADIKRSDDYDNNQKKDKISITPENIEDRETINGQKKNIVVDFDNLNDDVEYHPQHKDESISDNRSSQHTSNHMDMRDSLTFKPEGMLKVPHQDASNTPMSFGACVFETRKNEHDEYD